VERVELVDRRRAGLVGDEVAKLAKDVGRRLDELLVRRRGLEVAEADARGVGLEILGVGNDLDDAVPNLVGDVVAGETDELEDWIAGSDEGGRGLSEQPGDDKRSRCGSGDSLVSTYHSYSIAHFSVRIAILSTISSRRP
jgi:hypothetical protein